MVDQANEDRTDWRWLAGTYWYVPAADVPALQYNPLKNTLAWLSDQTVWHITGYENGYFWGVCSVVMTDANEKATGRNSRPRPIGMALLGSVTPEGAVQITFVRDAAISSASATVGVGRAIQVDGGVCLEMQMSTGLMDRTAHWAHMRMTRPGEPSFEALPGVGFSVTQMLEGIEPPSPPRAGV